jgi:membrane protease YdiL (CAAX protease family)
LLDLQYYFCVRCATAHRTPDDLIYGELPPLQPALERKVNTEGRETINFFCVLAVALAVVGSIWVAFGDAHFAGALLASNAVVAVVTTAYALLHRNETAHLFGAPRHWAPILAGVPILGGLLVLNIAYHSYLTSGLGLDRQSTLLALAVMRLHPAVAVACICVFPAVFEELGFRGFVQERLSGLAGKGIGWTMTSILFVSLHFTVVSAPYLFVMSLYLCWLRDRTRSLYPAMAAHLLHNAAMLP